MKDVLIIGAGSAGLALAYRLKCLGITPDIIDEAPEIASSWRGRHEQLSLNTHKKISDIPGLKIPAAYPIYPSRDQYVAYMEDCEKFLNIPIKFNTAARSIARNDAGSWLVDNGSESNEYKHVVVCTGSDHTPFIPDWPGKDKFKGELIHGGDFTHAKNYRGKSVLLVGAGNSGVDIGNYLAEEDLKPSWFSVRGGNWIAPKFLLGPFQPLLGNFQFLPMSVFDTVFKLLHKVLYRDLPALGLPEPVLGAGQLFTKKRMVPSLDDGFVKALRQNKFLAMPEIKQLTEDSVEFVNGKIVKPDAIICATGYKLGLENILVNIDILDETGFPKYIADSGSPSYPGLWFLGHNTSLFGNFFIRRQESEALARKIKQSLA